MGWTRRSRVNIEERKSDIDREREIITLPKFKTMFTRFMCNRLWPYRVENISYSSN